MWQHVIYWYLRLDLFMGNYFSVRDTILNWAKFGDQSFRAEVGWKIHKILLKKKGWYFCLSCNATMDTPLREGCQGSAPTCFCCGEYLYPHPNDKDWHRRILERQQKEREARWYISLVTNLLFFNFGLRFNEAELAAFDKRIQQRCNTIVRCTRVLQAGNRRSFLDHSRESFELDFAVQELQELVEEYRGFFP